MIFYFNSSGNLIEMMPREVYQGSNKVNAVYFIGPFAPTSQVTARLSLPNGEVMPTSLLKVSSVSVGELLNSDGDGLTIWEGSLDCYATKLSGNVYIQFAITSSTDTTTTEMASFVVRKGVCQSANVGISDENILDELLSEVASVNEAVTGIGSDKVTKVSGSTTYKQAYVKNADGSQSMVNIDAEASSAIVQRKANGNIITGTPTSNNEATPKEYVDSLFGNLPTDVSGGKAKYTLVEKIIVGYSVLLTKPANWETNYTDYYRNTGTKVKPEYTRVTDAVLPTWEIGVYYKFSNEGITEVTRTVDTNGNNYNYEGMAFSYEVPRATGYSYIYNWIRESYTDSWVFFFLNMGYLDNNREISFGYNKVDVYDSFYLFEGADPAHETGYNEMTKLSKSLVKKQGTNVEQRKINAVSFEGRSGVKIPSLTQIYIYKVEY